MLRTTGIYFIILVMILVKCFLPGEKPEIIPFPLQSVSDKGDFTFNKATLNSVENEKQAMIARELTDLFTLSAGFTPEIKIQDKRANIIFRTDRELAAEHYKLNIAPSCILIKASGQKGFFYAMQTLRFLLPPAINSQTQVENIQWNVPGMTILDGPRYSNRTVAIHTPFTLISKDNLKELIDHLAMLKINRLHFTQEVHDTTPEGQQKMKDMNLYAKSKKITISNGTTHTHDIISYLPFQAERLIWKANISDCDEDKKRLFQYLAPIAERSWSGNLLAHRLTQDIDQDGLQSAYETFHGDHHQYQSHQTHHHVISSLSQYTYQPGRSLQDQECDKIDQCDYSDQRTL